MHRDLPLSLRYLGIFTEKPIRRLSLLQLLGYSMNFHQLLLSLFYHPQKDQNDLLDIIGKAQVRNLFQCPAVDKRNNYGGFALLCKILHTSVMF